MTHLNRGAPTPIRTRTSAAWFAISIVAAVLAPMINLWRRQPRDSFPLSHYPMFSARRSTHLTVTYLRGRHRDGGYSMLDSRLAARGGMNQERKQIAKAVKRGKGQRVATKAARNVARRDLHPDVVAIEVVVGRFRLQDYFDAGPMVPDQATVVGRHPVPGRSELTMGAIDV